MLNVGLFNPWNFLNTVFHYVHNKVIYLGQEHHQEAEQSFEQQHFCIWDMQHAFDTIQRCILCEMSGCNSAILQFLLPQEPNILDIHYPQDPIHKKKKRTQSVSLKILRLLKNDLVDLLSLTSMVPCSISSNFLPEWGHLTPSSKTSNPPSWQMVQAFGISKI